MNDFPPKIVIRCPDSTCVYNYEKDHVCTKGGAVELKPYKYAYYHNVDSVPVMFCSSREGIGEENE
jgi:hypothetical protein